MKLAHVFVTTANLENYISLYIRAATNSALIDVGVRVVVDFSTLTASLGLALRCDISNISTAPSSLVQVVTYTLVNGGAFLVTADNPMNTANCTPGGSRQLLLPPQTGSNDGNNGGTLRAPPRLLLPTDVSSVNVTCTVPLRGPRLNASTVVTDLMAAPPASFVAVTALVAAQPALLGAGAPLGGGLFVSGTAVFAVPPTASATATATSSASSVPSPAISAPAFVVGTVTSSRALPSLAAQSSPLWCCSLLACSWCWH